MEITDLEKRTALSLLLPTLSGRPTAEQAAQAKADIVAARGSLQYHLDIETQKIFETANDKVRDREVDGWTGIKMALLN